jgi:predicted nucleic acid-binding protein
VCRDVKDNFLLDLCAAGKADYLITGDEDLLILGRFQHTQILDYRTFDQMLASGKFSV